MINRINYERVKQLLPNDIQIAFATYSKAQRRKIAEFVLENEKLGEKKLEYRIEMRKVFGQYGLVFLIKCADTSIGNGQYIEWAYEEVMARIYREQTRLEVFK